MLCSIISPQLIVTAAKSVANASTRCLVQTPTGRILLHRWIQHSQWDYRPQQPHSELRRKISLLNYRYADPNWWPGVTRIGIWRRCSMLWLHGSCSIIMPHWRERQMNGFQNFLVFATQ